jgi:thiol:disulfide interchange protein
MKRRPLMVSALLVGAATTPAWAQGDARLWSPIGFQDEAQPEGKSSPPKEKPPIYDEHADARQQIAAALAKAGRENRRVLVQWGANWCGWCHLLHEKFKSDKALARELLYEYDLVLVDIGKWDKNMELAASYGADLKAAGVPYLTVLDADGKVLANQDTGALEAKSSDGKPGHDGAKVLAFLKAHEATPWAADDVLQKGLAAAQAKNKAVFLHFGAPWCVWCHRLEDWMDKPDIAAILGKDLVDVKIDIDRMTGAKSVLDRYNTAGGQGIPWYVVISPDGKPVVTSDGPKGNIGFPATADEIAYFMQMMGKARKSMTPDDLKAIETSLKAGQIPPPSGG